MTDYDLIPFWLLAYMMYSLRGILVVSSPNTTVLVNSIELKRHHLKMKRNPLSKGWTFSEGSALEEISVFQTKTIF